MLLGENFIELMICNDFELWKMWLVSVFLCCLLRIESVISGISEGLIVLIVVLVEFYDLLC